MSHILDALRKAQDETTGTSRKSVTGSEALLARRGGSRLGGVTRRVWIMAGSGLFLLVVVGWVLYGPSHKSTPRKDVVQSVPSQPKPPAAPPLPTPPAAPPAVPPAAPPAAVPVQPSLPPTVPASAAGVSPSSQAAAVQAPATNQPEESEEGTASRNRRNRRGSKGENRTAAAPQVTAADSVAATSAPASKPAVPTVVSTPEGIKLTGIAWQENRKLRRAVINDVLVGEGVVVAGVKVLEIRPTAVRFEKNGAVYEVVLPR